MEEGGFFQQALIYLAAAVISVPLAKRLGLGSVLGYLLAGVVIGPFVLQLVGEEGQDVMHFAEFGVVMMLFLIGLELQPSLLWKLRGPILGVGGLQVGLTALAVTAIGTSLGISWQVSLAAGLILAMSSTAIVLQTLNEKGLAKTLGGQYSFSVLLFQDIAVIPILALLPLLASAPLSHDPAPGDLHAPGNLLEGLPIWGQTLVVLGVVTAIVFAGRYFITPVFRFIARTKLREIFTAAALLLVVGIAVLMSKVGLSPALGTFLAGVVLAQSEFRHELESDIEPFKGLLLGLFFIAVGASVDFRLIAEDPLLIAGLVLALIAVKFLVLFIIGRIFRMGLDHNLLFAFALAQGGEFAFVLFSFAVQNNVMSNAEANPLIAAVAISMALTPLIMLFNEKLIQPNFGTKEKEEREDDRVDEKNPVIIAGFGRMGSIIGRFLRANNLQATFLDIDADNVDLLRKLGLKVFYGDASRVDLLRAAGAAEAKLLIVAVDEPEKTFKIVEAAQKHFPHLKIMARANSYLDAYELFDMGVGQVYRETFDTALRIGADALTMMGQRAFRVNRAALTFRKHNERFIKEMANHRKDHVEWIRKLKQRIEDIEQIMTDEMERTGKDKDLGWDTSGLIEEFGGKPKEI
ncbi:MAG: monovalent cation:proton antiporter-2 (CPA2) family protein [Bacteroidales bacterium]|jgi:monovalent cation:proton antiporter-2 (CPA2) family protein|nr:monovalent cation:proton antiporter-2 (CPA2) family protein [Bacteroidales bacterium]